MLKGNRCENCSKVVEGSRAEHPRTRYRVPCAELRKKKRRQTAGNATTPKHSSQSIPKHSGRNPTETWRAIPLEMVRTVITDIGIIAVDLAGLIMIVTLLVRLILQ